MKTQKKSPKENNEKIIMAEWPEEQANLNFSKPSECFFI